MLFDLHFRQKMNYRVFIEPLEEGPLFELVRYISYKIMVKFHLFGVEKGGTKRLSELLNRLVCKEAHLVGHKLDVRQELASVLESRQEENAKYSLY